MKPSHSYSKRKPGRKKGFLKYLLIIIIIGAAFFWYRHSQYQYFIENPVDPTDNQNITFIIKKGESLTQVAQNLEDKDLILNADALKTYAKQTQTDRNIIAGRFAIQRSMTIPRVVETITNARNSETVITVLEGHTVADIDNTLVIAELIKPGEFSTAVNNFEDWDKYPFLDKDEQLGLIHPLEGYLFPDTYFIDPLNFYNENLIQLMLNNFQNRLTDEIDKDHGRSLRDIIIMASIVEKEVRTDNDIPIVAGILWKRLDEGWLIGADATLLYLKNDRTIDYNDLQEDTPYNTRKNSGLPPGPICNPGIKSIMGTLYPEDSPYWYYLTTPDTGEVIYARSNDEHNANKRKYL